MMEQAHDDDDDDDAQEMITSQLGCFFLWTKKVREKGATVVLHMAAACSLSSSSSFFFCSDNILDLDANLFCNLKWRERNGRRAFQKPTNIWKQHYTPHTPPAPKPKKSTWGWARPAHFGLRDRTLFQNGEKRFTLLQEDLQNSLRETRSQPASQPASRGKTDKSQGRERQRERSRPTLVLVCEREGQLVSQDLLTGNPSGSLFHFISHLQDTLVGPPRITHDCLHTLTSVAAKQKKQSKWGRKGSSSQQVFFRVFGVGGDFSHLITAAFPHTTNKPYKIPWLDISCNLKKL